MRISDALSYADRLNTDEARIDVEYLLCAVLGQSRSYLFTWPEHELSSAQQQRFDALIAQRKAGHPVAHLLGSKGFWTFDLEVDSSTLIPRADTEVLVELALSLHDDSNKRVLDLGTGSGAIAIAVALERPRWEVLASDRVAAAVALASRNAKALGADNLSLLQGSWFEPVKGRFDLILSNPPYIDPVDPHLVSGDLRFEPLSALVAEDKGLADLRLIVNQSPNYLHVGGWLALEHGYDQAEAVADLFVQAGFIDIQQRPDLGGNMRVSAGRWQG